jgi:hypothetical protein
MREISMRNSGTGRLMTGPDGAVYFIPDTSRVARSAPGNAVPGPAGSVVSAGVRTPEVAGIRSDLREKLGNLPQMPVWAC